MPSLDNLLEQERKYRTSKDTEKHKKVINELLSSCKTETDFISMLRILSKRKNQDQNIIKEIINSLEKNSIEFYEQLLQEVIEGRLWLENERIKVTLYLKDQYTKNNENNKALELLLSVPIEAFAVPMETIADFQLEQLRLAIITKNKLKQNTIEKRITKKFLDKERMLKYRLLKIDIHMQNNEYLEMVSELIEISQEYDEKKENKKLLDCNLMHKNLEILNNKNLINLISLMLILSKDKDNRKKSLVEYALYNKNNTESNRKYLRFLISNEIVDKHQLIKIVKNKLSKEFVCENEDDFINIASDSVDEHNIFIIANFFIKIRIDRFSSLLNLEINNLLEKLCKLVNDKKIYCRIDQDKEIVSFYEEKKEWSECVRETLEKLVIVDGILKKQKYGGR